MLPVSPVLIGYPNNTLEKRIAEDQPQYQTLPALPIDSDLPGTILTRWEVTDEEIEILKQTKSVYLYISTFLQPLQPVYLTVETPPVHEVDEKYAEKIRNEVPDTQGRSDNQPPIAQIIESQFQKTV